MDNMNSTQINIGDSNINKESSNDHLKIIEELYTKYKNFPYIIHRLNLQIENLPTILEQDAENYEKKQNRHALLNSEQKTFIQVFLKKHQYFYYSPNNTFFEYDNKHYTKIKEDDILYNLLTGISKDDILIQWKYKTKVNVIKIIKERNLLKSIPETYTIQRIIKFLSPSIFKTRNEAKYFLTIIGDNILKKKNNNIYLTNQVTKKLLNEIDNIIYAFLGLSNINNNFITKYHENNDYENYRLINALDTISMELIQEIIKKLGLDLLCVACHYSTRFTNSDTFLETKIEEELKNRVLFLKMNTPKTIIDTFCEQYIEKLPQIHPVTSQNSTFFSLHNNQITESIISNNTNNYLKQMNYSITWKNMHFIWKKYISNMGIPNILFYNTLKNLLKERFEYDETNDTFYDITSKYLPLVSEFINFWDNSIIYDIDFYDMPLQLSSPFGSPSESYLLQNYNNCGLDKTDAELIITNAENSFFINELETDEILFLFKYWCKTNKTSIPTTVLSLTTFYETEIIKILRHFYPNIKITNDKYISNIHCHLWNKNKNIDNALKLLKLQYKNQNKDVIIDFSEAYYYYAVYISNLNSKNSNKNKNNLNSLTIIDKQSDNIIECDFQMDDESAEKKEPTYACDPSSFPDLDNENEFENVDMKHIVVNKRYFEKYLRYSMSKYIVFDNFISTEWYTTD